MVDKLRDLYSRATILALIREGGQGWENVFTVVIYGSDLTAIVAFDVLSKSVRDVKFEAHRLVVDRATAESFADQARSSGSATIPEHGRNVRFTPKVCFDAFMPRNEYPDRETEHCSSTRSCWRRRATAKAPALGQVTLSDETLADIALALPSFDDADYLDLNVAQDLTRLQAIDEVFPIPMSLDVWGGDFTYGIDGDSAWFERFSPLAMTVDTYDFALRVGTYHADVTVHRGLLPLAPTSAVGTTLVASDGTLLDQTGGAFVRRVGINVGIAHPPLRLQVGRDPLDVPVAPRADAQTFAGDNEPSADMVTRRILARKWRELARAHEQFSERVFDGSDPEGCRADGIRLLSKMVSVVGKTGDVVKVVDPYALDAQALMALAPLAAGISGAEIWILTEGKRWVDNDKPSSEIPDLAAFAEVARQIVKILRGKIRVFEPTIPLHDRYLQIDGRIWHVGHSFNRFGCDFSAIVELRDPEEIEKLRTIFDQQFVGDGRVYE